MMLLVHDMKSSITPFSFVYCFIRDNRLDIKLSIILSSSELEWRLSESGAVKTDLEENPKKQIEDKLMSSIRSTLPTRKDSDSEED